VKNGQLQAVLEVTNAISNNMPAESLFHLYEAIVEGHLSVSILAFYIFDQTWKQVVCINSAEICERIQIPELLGKYRYSGELDKQDKKELPGIKYVIPVYHEEEPLAIALTGELNEGGDIPANESLEFAQTITHIVAVAVENQRLWTKEKRKLAFDKELELASKIQNLLVPGKLPKNKLYEFAGFYLPHKSIGGDYYDVININHSEFVFCIADISGKGVAAALVMANLQAYLNAIENFNLDDPSFIGRLNSKVFSVTGGDKFITLFIAKYNILKRELIYINAGHNPPILTRNGEEQLLDKGCTVIGAMEEIPHLTYGKEPIPVGSAILCYTDGLTELENDSGRQFSMKRLRLFTQQNYQLSPDVFVKSLTDQLARFKGQQLFNDDISVLACKFF
jgi:sigma-B regulation protein RsbU (phosphoserine phosphatase)